jgi:dolichol-phosphate mannosyltransferase
MTTAAIETTGATASGPEPSWPGIWVVLPTYNEAENVESMTGRVLGTLPDCRILIVDDASPDGTGIIADTLAAQDPRIQVLHRAGKEGLGRAYLAGFAAVLELGADIVVQMDADGSHDPAALWQLVRPIADGRADLAIGSRYVAGSMILDWGWQRRLISRGGSLYARTVLDVPVNDLTGGFKAWRSSTLASIDHDGIRAGGYVFQIEMTARALDGGARVTEVPIVFRDRRYGASKMSGHIVREAVLLVLRLGLERRTRRRPTQAPVR